jgi:hypothetical protein
MFEGWGSYIFWGFVILATIGWAWEKSGSVIGSLREQIPGLIPWLHLLGTITRLLIYAVLFLLLWIFKPSSDIAEQPLANLTLNVLFNIALWCGIGIVLIRALFAPSQEEEIRDAWGFFGCLLILGGIGVAVWVNQPEQWNAIQQYDRPLSSNAVVPKKEDALPQKQQVLTDEEVGLPPDPSALPARPK